MIDTDKYKGSKGQYFTGKQVDNYLNMQVEVKRLREQYTELREALIGDSPNWTHEELIEFTIKTLKIALDNIGDD
jgi:hypothetical protein